MSSVFIKSEKIISKHRTMTQRESMLHDKENFLKYNVGE